MSDRGRRSANWPGSQTVRVAVVAGLAVALLATAPHAFGADTPGEPLVLHVSPAGDDRWSGIEERLPLASPLALRFGPGIAAGSAL